MSTPTIRRGRKARRDPSPVSADTDPAPVWPGVSGGRYRPLSAAEEVAANETVLDLLETLGLSQPIPSMVDLVTARGGTLTPEGRLTFPRTLVQWALEGAKRDIVLYARKPGWDLDVSATRLHMSSGGGAPGVFDIDTGAYRDGTTQDLYDAARIVDTLDNIHHFSRSVIARDAGDNLQLDVNTAYACLAGTAKHVAMSISEPENMGAIAELCYAIAGGEVAFRARPFMTILVCHVVPPMRFAMEACETLELAIKAGFPVQIISAGQAGATSPATIAGSLVQSIAETLAGFVFARLVDEDVAAIFAPKPLVADLRTGAMCGGGGEQAVLMAAAAQMGRFYNLPTSSIAGITDAKTVDAQFGAEKTLAVTLAAQAGSNIITQACGMQASLLGVSLEAYVADNDMLGNILRTIRGVEVNTENMAAETIANVCTGEGHYLGDMQTLERMKSDYFYPHLGDRRTPRDWQEDGATTLHDRARKRAKEILATHHPAHISDVVDASIRANNTIVLSPKDMGKS
ncbi:MAG: trimethylamine methyltransferase family protein [Hyphomicrobiales bacterium]